MGAALGSPLASGPKLVCVEGNVAVGKSTCLQALSSMGYTVFTEPIDTSWAPLFALRSKDQERWAFTFQVRVFCTLHNQMCRAARLTGPVKDNVIFFERSPQAALAFSSVARAAGHLTSVEHTLLHELSAEMHTHPDMYIYLDLPATECMRRLSERNRDGEQSITLKDLKEIEAAMHVEHLSKNSIDASGPTNVTAASVLQLALSA